MSFFAFYFGTDLRDLNTVGDMRFSYWLTLVVA